MTDDGRYGNRRVTRLCHCISPVGLGAWLVDVLNGGGLLFDLMGLALGVATLSVGVATVSAILASIEAMVINDSISSSHT